MGTNPTVILRITSSAPLCERGKAPLFSGNNDVCNQQGDKLEVEPRQIGLLHPELRDVVEREDDEGYAAEREPAFPLNAAPTMPPA